MAPRIAVIGAGSAGLATIKSCLEGGLEPICFERTETVGGLWKYSEGPETRKGNVMRHTVTNVSKDIYCYSDYPPPDHYPNYLTHWRMYEYLCSYAEHFDLNKYIQFNTDVIKISKADDYASTGRWTVEVRKEGETESEIHTVDGVMIAVGYNCEKNMPNVPGMDTFEGKLMHSKDYRTRDGFEGQRVVVIGLGNSGGDVTTDVAKVAKMVYTSTARGAWIAPRTGVAGRPFDFYLLTRFWEFMSYILPYKWECYLAESPGKGFYNLKEFGLQPNHRYDQRIETISDELCPVLMQGLAQIRPGVRRINKRSVEFTDGTIEEDIDTIVCCTGYKPDYSFLDKSSVDYYKDGLYKRVFPPTLEKPTLSFIGSIYVQGGIIPACEIQARWAVHVFNGHDKLPSKEDQVAQVAAYKKEAIERWSVTQYQDMFVKHIEYMDDIAEQIGCRPNLFSILFKDPLLAWRMFFGRCMPAQYRLTGPHPWAGARDFIVQEEERWIKPQKKRTIKSIEENGTCPYTYLAIFALMTAFFLKFLSLWA